MAARHWAIQLSPSWTAKRVLVLPCSMASSIGPLGAPEEDVAGRDPPHLAGRQAQAKGAVGIEALGDAMRFRRRAGRHMVRQGHERGAVQASAIGGEARRFPERPPDVRRPRRATAAASGARAAARPCGRPGRSPAVRIARARGRGSPRQPTASQRRPSARGAGLRPGCRRPSSGDQGIVRPFEADAVGRAHRRSARSATARAATKETWAASAGG